MATMMETKPGNNGQVPSYSYNASTGQTGQAASNGGIQNPGYSGQHNFIPLTEVQPGLTGPANIGPVVITETEPQTQYALVWSTLSAIFCFLACGLAAIGVSWQARLQVLDGKYRHARHSLTVANILNCLALLFGLIFWGLLIWYFSLLLRPTEYYG